MRLVTFRGRLDLASLQESSSSRWRSIYLYSQAFDLPSEAQIDSGFSPLRNRCTAKIRCCVISSFMNTSKMVSVFIGLRDGYSIVRELCLRCCGTFFRPRCCGTQHLITSCKEIDSKFYNFINCLGSSYCLIYGFCSFCNVF